MNLTKHRQRPTKGDYLVQTVDSAEAEKACSRPWGSRRAPNRPVFLERTSKRRDRRWTNNELTWRGSAEEKNTVEQEGRVMESEAHRKGH